MIIIIHSVEGSAQQRHSARRLIIWDMRLTHEGVACRPIGVSWTPEKYRHQRGVTEFQPHQKLRGHFDDNVRLTQGEIIVRCLDASAGAGSAT